VRLWRLRDFSAFERGVEAELEDGALPTTIQGSEMLTMLCRLLPKPSLASLVKTESRSSPEYGLRWGASGAGKMISTLL